MADVSAAAVPASTTVQTSATPPAANSSAPTSAPPAGNAPAAAAAAPVTPKAPWGESPLRVPLKINGVEEFGEYASIEELQRELQQARLVHKVGKERKDLELKLADAEKRKVWEAEKIKADPLGYLASQHGVDLEAALGAFVANQQKLKTLSPEERAVRDREEWRRQELEPVKSELTKYQKRQQQAAADAIADATWQKLEPQYIASAKELGVELDEDTWEQIADQTVRWMDAGVELSPRQIVEEIKARDEKGFWGRMGKLTPDTAYKKLPRELVDGIVKLRVEEHRRSRNPAAVLQPAPPVPQPPRSEPSPYIDEFEFKRRERAEREALQKK